MDGHTNYRILTSSQQSGKSSKKHEITKIHSRIIKQYTKDQLHLVALHIGKVTQGQESTVPSF